MEAYSILKNGNEKLSEHFKVREFYCRDGSDPVFIDTALVEVLEKIRTHFGKPVTITSGFRTASWNAKQKNAAKFSQHLYGKDGSVHGTINGNGGYRYARRHLDDGVKGVYAIECGPFYGNPDYRQCGVGSNDAGQGGSHTGSGNNHFNAALTGILGKFLHCFRCAVGRESVHFERYMQVIEQLRGFLHNGEVGSATHDDANDWRHESLNY